MTIFLLFACHGQTTFSIEIHCHLIGVYSDGVMRVQHIRNWSNRCLWWQLQDLSFYHVRIFKLVPRCNTYITDTSLE
jgi:hypothetical protein